MIFGLIGLGTELLLSWIYLRTSPLAAARRKAPHNHQVRGRTVEYNDRIEALAQTSYPQVELLKQIKGVGS